MPAPSKPALLNNIHTARAKLETLISHLTDVQLTTPGAQGAWSVKDMLSHLAAWEQLTLERLNAGLGNRPLPMRPIKTDEDVQLMNDRVYARNQDRPLADVREDFQNSHAMLMEKVNDIDKKLIQDGAPMPWDNGRPLWQLIADNTYLHYAEHQTAIESWLARVSKWTIREETPEDVAGVRNVEELAFGRPDEANIVDGIRARGGVTLSLVAVEGEEIVGHVLFSPVTITGKKRVVEGVGMGPVAVLPSHQKSGVGSVLCHAGLVELAARGHKVAVVLGHPEYYPRFGFKSAEDFEIRCKWDVPAGVFMVKELQEDALEGVTGMVEYAPEFG
ncbi:MAG TPA: GNAT family N-acetyltransferase [Anaerolineales bacterium]|nr:GNAT family N-acetyltransferase [Anaerolineales bacterium]